MVIWGHPPGCLLIRHQVGVDAEIRTCGIRMIVDDTINHTWSFGPRREAEGKNLEILPTRVARGQYDSKDCQAQRVIGFLERVEVSVRNADLGVRCKRLTALSARCGQE